MYENNYKHVSGSENMLHFGESTQRTHFKYNIYIILVTVDYQHSRF